MNKIQFILQCAGLAIMFQVAAFAWEPPIGIPRPEFGIEETYRMYDNPATRNPALTYTQNAEGGYYTHYVDNTHPDATSSNNPYGTASKPRTHLPSADLPSGSVVEVHGGPYTYASGFLIKGYGISALPIFVRGVDTGENTPYFDGFLHPEGTYLIVEGLSASGCLVMGENGGTRDSNYVSFRANDIYPLDKVTGGSVGVLGEYSSTADPPQRADNVVIYNNTVHDFGDLSTLEDDDWGQIHVSYFSKDVWIIDNEIYGSTGGGVGISGGKYDPPILCERIYVGRNYIHDSRAYGVWVKYGKDIVFSQNTIHDVNSKPSWTEEGKGMGYQYWPYSVWYIFNEVYNCVRGFAGATAHEAMKSAGAPGPPQIYLIGNLIYGYEEPEKEEWKTLNWGGIASSGTSSTYIIGNTVHSYPWGMTLQDLDEFIIMNNTIMDVNATKGHIRVEAEVAPSSVLENNLFYQSGGPVVINWGGPIFNDMDVLRVQTSTGQGCIVGDPQFLDALNNDFRLQSTSPAIDAGKSDGAVATVFDLYQTTFGIDIRKDIEKTSRPQGSEWDIGAYEWGSTPADPDSDTKADPGTDAEPEAVIPDADALVVMNNIIKTGGNQSAWIRCDMKDPGKLTVRIYDAKGKEIITLSGEERQAGQYEFMWSGLDYSGKNVGSGIYLVHMKSGSYSETKKIPVVK